MDFKDYLEIIKDRLSTYYDVKGNHSLLNIQFDLYGYFNVRSEKFLATRKLTIYDYENNEHVLMKYYPSITKEILNNFIEKLKKSIETLVNPNDEHMSTTITGVIVVDKINEEKIIKEIKEFKYQKGFLFGLKGWADIIIVLVVLEDEKVIASKRGKKVISLYKIS